MNRLKPLHAYVKRDAAKFLPADLSEHAPAMNLLQHRILTKRWQRQTDSTARFTILKREYVNAELTWPIASKLLIWGKQAGAILCDGQYIEGAKSFGYRLSDQLEALPTSRVQIDSPALLGRIRAFERRESKNFTSAHRHLKKWLEQVSISCGALDAAMELSGSPEQRESNVGAVRMLTDGSFNFGICDYGRCHTNITRLFRPLRRFLRLSGDALCSIDIANSQPLFLGIALLSSLALSPALQEQSSPIRCHSERFSDHKYEEFQQHTNDPKVPKTHKENQPELSDLQTYIATCERGELYPQLMDEMGWTKGKDAFKSDAWFQFLYGSNKTDKTLSRDDNHHLKQLTTIFKGKYPTVLNYMHDQKQRNYRQLAWKMQRAESSVMIDRVGSRLAADHPEIPVLTIHDSYMTTKPHVETISRLVREEFAEFNVTPTLTIEEYAQGGHADG